MSLPALEEPLKLLEQKEIDAAIEVLEQKVRRLPAHLTAHVLLARAYEAQERWDQALRSWGNAYVLLPNSPIVEQGKKRVLRRMDDAEESSDRSAIVAGLEARLASGESSLEQDEDPDTEATSEEGSATTGESDDLAQLRRWAEKEARQGGARPDLPDKPSPSGPSSSDEPPSTPEEQIEKFEEESSDADLEGLIEDLESARVDPDPDAGDAPPPEPEDDTQDMVSETLAQIHESQANYQEAARIYGELASQEPDRADEFRQKAAEMRELADTTDEGE
ncbi:MAG: tetratricopeptide repeat protein [Salinibacter sp.]|uniref:tetratricopeptide repeat protein n=1 Tax=Salinibacter sp. TaxID=2065818 RepID=UPI0035D41815